MKKNLPTLSNIPKMAKGTSTGLNSLVSPLDSFVYPYPRLNPFEVNGIRKNLRIIVIGRDMNLVKNLPGNVMENLMIDQLNEIPQESFV